MKYLVTRSHNNNNNNKFNHFSFYTVYILFNFNRLSILNHRDVSNTLGQHFDHSCNDESGG